MDALSLGIHSINNLSLMLTNPALEDARLNQVGDLLGVLGTLLAEGGDAIEDMKAFSAQVEAMTLEEPSPVVKEPEKKPMKKSTKGKK